MPSKANLGKNELEAVRLAHVLNTRYRIRCEQEATRLEASVDVGGVSFADAFGAFVEKYNVDYCLKFEHGTVAPPASAEACGGARPDAGSDDHHPDAAGDNPTRQPVRAM